MQERQKSAPKADPAAKQAQPEATEGALPTQCAMPRTPEREFSPGIAVGRVRAIINSDRKWANGTRLRYHFFNRNTDGSLVRLRDGTRRFVPWAGSDADMEVVHKAFQIWKDVGIGLSFQEVADRRDAEIRIGFMAGDGHWSYLGRDILKYQTGHRTMNLDGPLVGTKGLDTALHEIGHTLGMPHEHQNPFAGIDWNEGEVYRRLALPPNNWDADTTYWNILRKIPAAEVTGTDHDPNSIMHYSFEQGMINAPVIYRDGLRPDPGLSDLDKAWVREVYPPQDPLEALPRLERFESMRVSLGEGDQVDALFVPEETGPHVFATMGETDFLLTIFEDTPDGPQFLAGDDDSGEERNAEIRLRLIRSKRYIVRARLYYSRSGGTCALVVV